ncbi:MAG: IPT/TIG domain-containing protein [Candidatus Rokuibacteriota bacterium]
MQKLRHRVRPSLLLAIAAWLLLAPLPALAQQAAIQYVYDDLNRLIAVVDQQGNVGFYTYDPVGNILKIERFDAAAIPGAVGITLVSPNSGKPGTVVQIFGKGFSATPAQNSVTFNGTPAAVTASAPNRIVTAVPNGATTGPIVLTTPLGSATSPTPFTVVASIAIDPTSITLAFNGTQQFTVTEDGGGAPAVRWSVNDITGGDPSVGTISTEGLFTAPAGAPLDGLTVTVAATHTDDPTVSGSATVTIRQPQPVFVAAAGGVGVRLAEQAVNQNVTASVGVVVAEAGLRPVIAPGVGVQFFGVDPVTALAAAVGVGVEPLVASISPSSAARETVDLLITITGTGLSDATSVSFLLNNVPDANITVTNLAVAPDGGQATAQISIASNAAVGPRVVHITTPARTSTTAGTGGNVFTVQ